MTRLFVTLVLWSVLATSAMLRTGPSRPLNTSMSGIAAQVRSTASWITSVSHAWAGNWL